MKWIGLALIAFGALLALEHRNGFLPVALGVFILGYWYFLEREPNSVPPDESDYLQRDQPPPTLEESSTSFDLPDVAPFLRCLSARISGGYTDKVIDHIHDLASRMKHEEERSLDYEVVFQGQRIPLNIGLFKDDIEEISIFFHTTKPLVEFIDNEMGSFFAERRK